MDADNGGYDWFITDATHVLGFSLWMKHKGDRWRRHPGPVTLLVEKRYPTHDWGAGLMRRTAWWDGPGGAASRPDGAWVESRARYAVQLEHDVTSCEFWPPADPNDLDPDTRVVVIPAGEHPDELDDDDDA